MTVGHDLDDAVAGEGDGALDNGVRENDAGVGEKGRIHGGERCGGRVFT
jgi:hypothetical protein